MDDLRTPWRVITDSFDRGSITVTRVPSRFSRINFYTTSFYKFLYVQKNIIIKFIYNEIHFVSIFYMIDQVKVKNFFIYVNISYLEILIVYNFTSSRITTLVVIQKKEVPHKRSKKGKWCYLYLKKTSYNTVKSSKSLNK